MTQLPYSFDLCFDLKTMEDIESFCKGNKPCGTSATKFSLIELFIAEGLDIPECLINLKDKPDDLTNKFQVFFTVESRDLTIKQIKQIMDGCLNAGTVIYADIKNADIKEIE